MGSAPGDRPHVWLPGTGGPLLLLHGTGGDEHDLLPLRDHLAPGAPVLSPRGTVSEAGMPRFFRRSGEGVFDEEDLRERVDELAGFLVWAQGEYGVEQGSWTAVGFSNGANIASAMLLRRPETLAASVLLAAMVPFVEPPQANLVGRRVAVSNGTADPIVPAGHTAELVTQLRDRGAEVVEHHHRGGHSVDADVLPALREFVAG